MVLVDTSVWIRFLANRTPYAIELDRLLSLDEVSGHELVYGELLIGDRGGRGKLLAAYEQTQTLRSRALPAAEVAYKGTRDGYRKGLFTYLDVLDAQRTLFMLRARKLNVLLAYHLARADIERLTATPLLNGTPTGEQR